MTAWDTALGWRSAGVCMEAAYFVSSMDLVGMTFTLRAEFKRGESMPRRRWWLGFMFRLSRLLAFILCTWRFLF